MTVDTSVIFWPTFVDVLVSMLMIFLLVHFLQTGLSLDDVKARIAYSRRAEFIKVFSQEFAREIEDETVSVDAQLNLLQIRFSDKILFESGDYVLQERGVKVLQRCAKIFNRVGNSAYEQIQVEGHTDNVGSAETNWELSTRRAISVVQLFAGTGQLDPQKLSANGYAFYKPRVPNTTPKNRALNRRIEIRIVFFIQKGESR